jgi:hypothetical protein
MELLALQMKHMSPQGNFTVAYINGICRCLAQAVFHECFL